MRSNRPFQWALVFIFASTAVVSRLKYNGLFLNFDYGIYQPDGSHYAYRTLTFLGFDPNIAAERVVQWYQIHGFKNNSFAVSLLSPENTETWGLVAPRVIYSFLSLPFVYFLGISGMMIIPILSFLLLIFLIFRISLNHDKDIVGLLLVAVLTTSPTVLRWMIANITDSLLTGLFGLVVLLLSKGSASKSWRYWMVILIFLTSFTRFCLPIWVAISITYWIKKERSNAVIILFFSLLAFIPTYLYMPQNALLPAETEAHGITKVWLLAESFFKVGFIEVAQLAALDRTLLLTLGLAIAISIKFPKELSSQLFISVLISVWLIGAINGTLGVNFRYQLPILGFAVWTIVSNLEQFANWIRRRRPYVVREKTKN